jgi:nucleotide-binding universal stress UspA family protein
MAHKKMKVLIEYDGSKRAGDALEDLRNAGLPQEAKAKIVTIVEPIILAGMPEAAWDGTLAKVTEHEIHQSKIAIKKACQRLRELLPDWEVDYATYLGRTEQELIELAGEWKPDLVVISPQYRDEWSRQIFGSLSRNIVERSSCSVRVARPADKRDRAWLRLLIGFDGSNGSTAAVREVASRCWPSGTEVRIVACFKSSSFYPPKKFYPDKVILRTCPDTLIDPLIKMLRAAGLDASSVMREGTLKDVILKEATRFGAHCIFLGSDGRGGLRRLFFSSVAAAVAARASCAVEVVRKKPWRVAATDAGARLEAKERPVFEAVG